MVTVPAARTRAAVKLATVMVLVSLLVPLNAARAQEGEADAARDAQALAEMYAPVMMLKAGDGPCDPHGEMYAPTTVDIVLDNPEIMLREVSIGDPLIMRGPSGSDLFGLGEGFFLDFPGVAVDPGCLYERDFDVFSDGREPIVYAHVATQADEPGLLALQYWFYWYFNDFNDKHESDWEGIQLLFEASTVEQALASDPVEVAYAQHEGGERSEWDAAKLERDGTHPVVYSSKGSHASYYGSALYLGRRGTQGFGCDNTDGPSVRIEPGVILLPDSVDDPADPLAWLMFEGRWGERRKGSFNGPTGPIAKERWLQPVDWQERLRSSSVVIPRGDTRGDQTIEVFCNAVAWGSGTLVRFTQSPARVLITTGVVAAFALWLARRTDWARVALVPIRRRRRAGQIIRAAAGSYRTSTRALIGFGAIYLPIAVVIGLIGSLLSIAPVVGEIHDLAGRTSGTSLVLALLAGSIPHLVAFVTVNAMVSTYLDELASGTAPRAAEVARFAWQRRRQLLSGLVRATAIVVALLITVVGIPWGIRQLVRYQFMPQAVMLDRQDGRGALARSSDLVRGRWWHTAVVLGSFQALAAAAALVFALVLLLVLPSIPLWLFSGVVALANAVVVPVAAIAQTLLYGDAAAEREPAPDADLVSV